ncbi:MAG: T9SS type A sorting domain-containing protein [Chitinophagaceae bacterium]|nr:T9SS type A sorting domain-containing protein [Chitinophagaceae bacterium]
MDAQLIFPKSSVQLFSENEIRFFLKNTQKELESPHVDLQLKYKKKSKMAIHYLFELSYQKYPIFNSSIKINLDNQGRVLSIKKENTHTDELHKINFQNEIIAFQKLKIQDIIGEKFPIKSMNFKIDNSSDSPQLIYEVNSWSSTHDLTFIINTSGEILKHWDQCRYNKIDTIIQAHVFSPDPLTAQQLTYGMPYIDGADSNLSWFAPAYFQVPILATYDNQTNEFLLENQWVQITDFDAPNIAPVTKATPDFFFNRSQSGFEDVNVLYHITTFHQYISSIGYDSLLYEGIRADTHGMGGFADNSMFNRNGGFPLLDFGLGGVDDAEDADVIIHEYAHGLSWSANANENYSFERSALDEGVGDYFATSYSRAINPFRWEHLYSWDGNNEFWQGRIANTALNYPDGATIYSKGEIWNAAMSNIYTDLGQIVCDKLMLESLYFFTNQTTFPEAALYVLQADTLLFNGQHTNVICNRFAEKNIVDANCKPTSVLPTPNYSDEVQVKNTYGFLIKNEKIEIHFPHLSSGFLNIVDMNGVGLFKQYFQNETTLFLSNLNLQRGVYILQIQYNGKLKNVKIVK